MTERILITPSDEVLVTVHEPAFVTIDTEPTGTDFDTRIRDRVERLERENRVLLARMHALEDELEVPPEHRRWKLPTLPSDTPTTMPTSN